MRFFMITFISVVNNILSTSLGSQKTIMGKQVLLYTEAAANVGENVLLQTITKIDCFMAKFR